LGFGFGIRLGPGPRRRAPRGRGGLLAALGGAPRGLGARLGGQEPGASWLRLWGLVVDLNAGWRPGALHGCGGLLGLGRRDFGARLVGALQLRARLGSVGACGLEAAATGISSLLKKLKKIKIKNKIQLIMEPGTSS
jgi:hypothetical protein